MNEMAVSNLKATGNGGKDRRITASELRALGCEYGEFLAKVFEKFTESYGNAIPNNIVELFLDFQIVRINGFMGQLRNAGLNGHEIDTWHRALRGAVKKQGVSLLAGMNRKH
jgi:hypothetical protein